MSDELLPTTPDVVEGDAAPQQAENTKPVTRRAALKVLGSVPIAGALIGGSAFAQQGTPSGAQQPKQTHEAPFPPRKVRGRPRPPRRSGRSSPPRSGAR